MPPKQNKNQNPAVQKGSKAVLSMQAKSNPANAAAHKAAVSFAKNQLGRGFDSRSYYSVLSDSLRGYLAVLVNPFELRTLKKSAGIPVAPSVPSRKYSCFARGTFSTCPRDTSSAQWSALTEGQADSLREMTEPNLGWLMVSPKLFGVNTTNTTYSRSKYEGRNYTATNGTIAVDTDVGRVLTPVQYTLLQQPVVYTSHNSTFGAPARLCEFNPVLGGERMPVVAVAEAPSPVENIPIVYSSPGLDLFTVPNSTSDSSPDCPANKSCVTFLATNIERTGSNSDVPWWEVMPPDPYAPPSGSLMSGNGFLNSPDMPLVTNGDAALTIMRSGAGLLNTRKFRLVSCGVRIKYIGAEINRGGQVIGLREPSGLTMASGSYGGIVVAAPNTPVGVKLPGFGGSAPFAVSPDIPVTPTNGNIIGANTGGYELSPSFRSADWRVFCGTNPGAFGCNLENYDIEDGGASVQDFSQMGQPFDTVVNPDDSYGFDQLSEYDQGVPGDVERPWDELVYYPIDPTSAKYEYLYETVSTMQPMRMGSTTPVVYVADAASEKTKETPTPTPQSFKLGHFQVRGKYMSATQTCEWLSKKLSQEYAQHKKKTEDVVRMLQTKPGKESLSAVFPKLGLAIGSSTNQRADTSGGVNVSMGISRADNDWGYSLAWIVRGPDDTTVTKFQFEVCGHYEIIGREVRGQTQGAMPDPIGIAAMSALGPSLTVATTSDGQTKRKLDVAASASQVVQAVRSQSGVPDSTDNIHSHIMKAANTASSVVKTAKTVAQTVDEVKDFVEPLLEGLAALF